MLSSDRSGPSAGEPRQVAGHAVLPEEEPWDEVQTYNPNEPWDAHAAEALTRLCESDEGRLSRPAGGERVRSWCRQSAADGAPEAAASPVDRAWLETRLSKFAEGVQDLLARSSAEPSLAALHGRLEAIEQRFGAALGRVAQRADLEGLRSIEAHVLELAAQLERARDRLEQIGAVDEEVRSLARKLDEAGEQRASALEKLLRDSVAEWREGEQRTAGALHNLEEAVCRLGETLDAMEASKPAPDLSVSTLVGVEPARVVPNGVYALQGSDERRPAAHFYHDAYRETLDAANYMPKPPAEEPLRAAVARDRWQAPGVVEWSAGAGEADPARREGAKLTPGALRIMALRRKLRQSRGGTGKRASGVGSEARDATPVPWSLRRARLGLLLMAGAAILAGSTYLVYQTFVSATPPAGSVQTEPGAYPAGVKSNLADPAGRRGSGAGAS